MRFYTQQHQFYRGIDLYARTMYVCIMNNEGKILKHKNMAATAENLIEVIEPTGATWCSPWSASSPGAGLQICAARARSIISSVARAYCL